VSKEQKREHISLLAKKTRLLKDKGGGGGQREGSISMADRKRRTKRIRTRDVILRKNNAFNRRRSSEDRSNTQKKKNTPHQKHTISRKEVF